MALKTMLGPMPSFLYGWSLLWAIQTGVLVIIAFFAADNLAVALLGSPWANSTLSKSVASLLILSLAMANLRGALHGAWIQSLTSAAKLIILAGLVLMGLYAFGFETETLTAPRIQETGTQAPWMAGLAAVLFSYGGFHQITWVAGEMKQPQKTVPRSILFGIAIVLIAYLSSNLAYFALLPFDHVVQSQTLAADATATLFPDWAGRATAAALCVSAYGIANASLFTTPRVYYALARQKLFFGTFARLHGPTGVPRPAILLQTALALALLWLAGPDRMDQLVNGVVFVDWTFHILTCAGLLYWRSRHQEIDAGYRAPWMPLPPLLFILGSGLALGATFWNPAVRQSSLLGLGILLSGVLFYGLFFRRRASA